MPKHFSDEQYGQAVFESVQSGAYPESEELVSAEFPSSALPKIIQLVEKKREDVKANVKRLSKESAPDIDGWISQAKQLRGDIEHSKEQSRAIVTQAQDGQQLQDQVNDAASKLRLLRDEVVFNGNLATTMQRILAVRTTLDRIQEAILGNDFLEAAGLLDQGDEELGSLRECQDSRVAALLRTRIADLRQDVILNTRKCWDELIYVNAATSTVTIREQFDGSHSFDLNTVTLALLKLQVLEPSLQRQARGHSGALYIKGNEISISQSSSDASLRALFSDICSIIIFLRTRLPRTVVAPLSGMLMPNLISSVLSTWLSSAVPTDLNGMQDFQGTIELVLQFAEDLKSYQWPGTSDLVTWTEEIPSVWLEKRRETSLDGIRELLSKGLGKIHTVERVETQTLSQENDVLAASGGDDDWNAEWSDEEVKDSVKPTAERGGDNDEGENISAWGLDDDTFDQNIKEAPTHPDAAADDADAWGWGDEADTVAPSEPSKHTPNGSTKSRVDGHPAAAPDAEREVTLKETYNITSVPSGVLEILTKIRSDAETLAKPDYSKLPVASAAADLPLLSGLVLSMYRASAPTYYTQNVNGSMFLYNDSLWMTECLQKNAENYRKHAGKPKLLTDIQALEIFGKRAYGKEMESQRTIIGDLLDDAQGFANCTETPFAQECDLAINSVVDRLRHVHKQWKTVLSHSALLQSLGSLLSTVVNKIIVDVCDMSDISEPESQRLTAFCNRITTLEDIFAPEKTQGITTDAQHTVPLTAVYTPNWLKFQYLSQILDSTLVDIKYLWTEGELRLEFSADELSDLIQALFADSEHRRRAIAQIRRS